MNFNERISNIFYKFAEYCARVSVHFKYGFAIKHNWVSMVSYQHKCEVHKYYISVLSNY